MIFLSFMTKFSIAMKIKLCFAFLAVISALTLHAQNRLFYNYDTTGNRIYRLAANLRGNEMTRSLNDSMPFLSRARTDIQLSQNSNKLKIEIRNWDEKNLPSMTIHDLSGREMFSKPLISGVTIIDISKLRSGTYILSVNFGDEITSKKFNK